MGKDASPSRFKPNQAGATAKFLRVPPRKARLVMDAVRGKYVADALAVLKFVPNFAARAIEDVIKSAVANAENSRPFDEETNRPLPPLIAENLKLVRAWVDEGPRIKRIQPRAQGRAYRIVKRMCHLSVIVEEMAPRPKPQRKPRAAVRRPAAEAAPAARAPKAQPAPVAPTETTAEESALGPEDVMTTEEIAAVETPEETALGPEAVADAEATTDTPEGEPRSQEA